MTIALTSNVGLSHLEIPVESRETAQRCFLCLWPPEVCEAAQTWVNEAWVQHAPVTGLAWRISQCCPTTALHLSLNGNVLCLGQPQHHMHGVALGQRGNMNLVMEGDLHSVYL